LFAENRNKLGIMHPFPDLRYVFLHELCGNCMGLSRTACLLEDREGDIAWWQGHAEPRARLTPQLVDTWHQQVRHLATVGFVQGIVRLLDQSLRQVAIAVFPEGFDVGRMKSSKVEAALLAHFEMGEFGGLQRLFQVLRDLLSSHNKFRPVGQAKLYLQYKDRHFAFDGEEVDFSSFGFLDFWEMLQFLLEELCDFWMKLSLKLHAHPFLKTPYLD
jgi:hypothetical protein